MKDYRLYILDSFSGHIAEVHEIEARDDEQALAAARRIGGDRPMELWHRHHKLHHWDEPVSSPD